VRWPADSPGLPRRASAGRVVSIRAILQEMFLQVSQMHAKIFLRFAYANIPPLRIIPATYDRLQTSQRKDSGMASSRNSMKSLLWVLSLALELSVLFLHYHPIPVEGKSGIPYPGSITRHSSATFDGIDVQAAD